MIIIKKLTLAKVPAGSTLEQHVNDQIARDPQLSAARLVAIHEIDHRVDVEPTNSGSSVGTLLPTALRLYFEA